MKKSTAFILFLISVLCFANINALQAGPTYVTLTSNALDLTAGVDPKGINYASNNSPVEADRTGKLITGTDGVGSF